QQDIYAAGSESRPSMLNKENYVPWSSRLLRYAKNDELSDKELKQIEADDQAIQTILLGLPEYIYAANGLIGVQGNGNGNPVAVRAEGNAAGQNGNQIRCYNCRGVGHYARNCTVRPRRRDAAYLQTQSLIAQKEEAGIQLQAEEYDLMVVAADLDDIEEVNANCILMADLQQASTSGTQTDSAPVYDTNGSAEVHENCDDNEIFNMFTQEEQYTELLEPIPESHQVPQNDNDVISEDTSVEQGGETVEQHPANFEKTCTLYESLDQNLAIKVEKVNSSTVSFLLEEKKKLKSDFKTHEDKFLDKQIQLEKKIKELNNILLKTSQLIQTIHMLSPKPDSFYHIEQKMALGYQNPFYLKQSQKKQQSLYNGKVLLEKHDPPVVHDSEETLQLAQESHDKMKQMNKEIKPANYTKINHLLGVFVPQTALSREELYFLNNSKTANVLKSFLIPNEDLSDDTTPSVARKFLNEEASKFVGDYKSLANEADASLAKHKALKLEIECLLNAIVSQDIMIFVKNESVVDTSDLQTELEHTRNPLSHKLENENVELEFQVLNYARENAHLKATYKNLFDSISTSLTSNSVSTPQEFKRVNNDNVIAPGMFRINPSKTFRDEKHVPNTVSASARTKPITVSQPPVITKKDVNSDINGLSSTGVDNTKTRRPQPRSNTKHDSVPSTSKSNRSKNKEAEVE
nr:hypothetical protein [Tanacetum cinerariifolium]